MKNNYFKLVMYSRIVFVFIFIVIAFMSYTYNKLTLEFNTFQAYVEVEHGFDHLEYLLEYSGGELVYPHETLYFSNPGDVIVSYKLKKFFVVRYFNLNLKVYNNINTNNMYLPL